jgi:SET domain-containing protein
MWTGDIVGEYVGQLLAFEGKVDGLPPTAWKYNSGYTLLFNKRSTKKKFIYVEAASCGSITRFINHSCRPNADFIEMSNGRNHKVLVVMNHPVTQGMEITVNYGHDKEFKCQCEECE